MTNAETTPAPVLQWTLGDRLGKALRVAGISNEQMAEYLGVSRNTVGNYIADRVAVKDGTIRNWADKTGVPYWEIKTGLPAGFGTTPPDGGVSESTAKITDWLSRSGKVTGENIKAA